MGEKSREKESPSIKIGPEILKLLSKFAEIELEDVEIEIGDLEISIQPSIPVPTAVVPRTIPTLRNVKPTKLLETAFRIPKGDYPGKIVEVKLGANGFDSHVIHPPVIAFDVFDKPPRLAKVMRAPFADVLDDPAAWAKRCVDKFGAEMVQLHLTSIDPLLMNTSPKEAAKTVENVLEAVDVPLAVGGCGDPAKDLKVFKKVAEVCEGEMLLINSVTLDMDIQGMAELVKKHGHAVIAFTSMDMALARELNRKLYEFLPKEDIVIDTTTAALGYGLD